MSNAVKIYDTTLRDGTQGEGISFSVTDKLLIAEKLDHFGVDYIEGGFPGSNPRDITFFQEAKKLRLTHARLAAFGSTRRAGARADEDGQFDWIPVHLVLTEYESVKTQLANQAAGAGASDDAAAEGAEAIEGNAELNHELGYVRDQFNAGMEEGSGTDTPSEDLDDPDE